jgi:hypothetical protein
MNNIRLPLISNSLTSSSFKLAQLVNIKFSSNLNCHKVSTRMFCMQTLALRIQKLMPPLKESGHD